MLETLFKFAGKEERRCSQGSWGFGWFTDYIVGGKCGSISGGFSEVSSKAREVDGVPSAISGEDYYDLIVFD